MSLDVSRALRHVAHRVRELRVGVRVLSALRKRNDVVDMPALGRVHGLVTDATDPLIAGEHDARIDVFDERASHSRPSSQHALAGDCAFPRRVLARPFQAVGALALRVLSPPLLSQRARFVRMCAMPVPRASSSSESLRLRVATGLPGCFSAVLLRLPCGRVFGTPSPRLFARSLTVAHLPARLWMLSSFQTLSRECARCISRVASCCRRVRLLAVRGVPGASPRANLLAVHCVVFPLAVWMSGRPFAPARARLLWISRVLLTRAFTSAQGASRIATVWSFAINPKCREWLSRRAPRAPFQRRILVSHCRATSNRGVVVRSRQALNTSTGSAYCTPAGSTFLQDTFRSLQKAG